MHQLGASHRSNTLGGPLTTLHTLHPHCITGEIITQYPTPKRAPVNPSLHAKCTKQRTSTCAAQLKNQQTRMSPGPPQRASQPHAPHQSSGMCSQVVTTGLHHHHIIPFASVQSPYSPMAPAATSYKLRDVGQPHSYDLNHRDNTHSQRLHPKATPRIRKLYTCWSVSITPRNPCAPNPSPWLRIIPQVE